MTSYMIKGYRVIFADGESRYPYDTMGRRWTVESKRERLKSLEDGEFPGTIDNINEMRHLHYRPPGMGIEGDSWGHKYKPRGFTLW